MQHCGRGRIWNVPCHMLLGILQPVYAFIEYRSEELASGLAYYLSPVNFNGEKYIS